MRAIYLAPLLLISACSKSPLEVSRLDAMASIRQSCAARGGDELVPYGIRSWLQFAAMSQPMAFRCVRLDAVKTALAVYILRVENDHVTVVER